MNQLVRFIQTIKYRYSKAVLISTVVIRRCGTVVYDRYCCSSRDGFFSVGELDEGVGDFIFLLRWEQQLIHVLVGFISSDSGQTINCSEDLCVCGGPTNN